MELINYLTENNIVLYGLIITFSLILIILIATKKSKKKPEKLSDELVKMVTGDIDATDEDKKEDLTTLLEEMQKTVEQKTNSVSSFEQEQEEKAIISYQELINANKKLKEELNLKNEIIASHEKQIEPSIEEAVNDVVEVRENSSKKFQNTDFISPIYGKLEPELSYPTVPKIDRDVRTLQTEEVDISLDGQDDDFLKALKEFRKNLD